MPCNGFIEESMMSSDGNSNGNGNNWNAGMRRGRPREWALMPHQHVGPPGGGEFHPRGGGTFNGWNNHLRIGIHQRQHYQQQQQQQQRQRQQQHHHNHHQQHHQQQQQQFPTQVLAQSLPSHLTYHNHQWQRQPNPQSQNQLASMTPSYHFPTQPQQQQLHHTHITTFHATNKSLPNDFLQPILPRPQAPPPPPHPPLPPPHGDPRTNLNRSQDSNRNFNHIRDHISQKRETPKNANIHVQPPHTQQITTLNHNNSSKPCLSQSQPKSQEQVENAKNQRNTETNTKTNPNTNTNTNQSQQTTDTNQPNQRKENVALKHPKQKPASHQKQNKDNQQKLKQLHTTKKLDLQINAIKNALNQIPTMESNEVTEVHQTAKITHTSAAKPSQPDDTLDDAPMELDLPQGAGNGHGNQEELQELRRKKLLARKKELLDKLNLKPPPPLQEKKAKLLEAKKKLAEALRKRRSSSPTAQTIPDITALTQSLMISNISSLGPPAKIRIQEENQHELDHLDESDYMTSEDEEEVLEKKRKQEADLQESIKKLRRQYNLKKTKVTKEDLQRKQNSLKKQVGEASMRNVKAKQRNLLQVQKLKISQIEAELSKNSKDIQDIQKALSSLERDMMECETRELYLDEMIRKGQRNLLEARSKRHDLQNSLS